MTCGRGHLRKLPPVVKMVYDFAGGNSMEVECVAYVMKRGSCKRCGHQGQGVGGSSECLFLERAVLEIASSYPEGHRFRIKLEGAAPHLFTFLRYPDMPPHNNGAELEIRNTAVLHMNVRHQLSTMEGRKVFSVLVSVARTCRKPGIFLRTAVECLIREPDWRLFKSPPGQELVAPLAAAC